MDRMLRNGVIAFALTATALIAVASPANAQVQATRTSAVASANLRAAQWLKALEVTRRTTRVHRASAVVNASKGAAK